MKRWYKWLALVLVSAMLFGCQPTATVEKTEAATEAAAPVTEAATEGEKVVEVTSKGHSEDLKMKVTFDGNVIKNVEVVSHNETENISAPAIAELPAKIVEHNSVAVDGISGATETSNGIIEGVKMAIAEAGLNLSDFETPVEEVKTGEAVELETDVVVVGAGITGLSAALEAQAQGVKVILLEKMPITGGSSMMSGGYILGAESSIQKEGNVEGAWEDFANYLYTVSEEQADKAMIDAAAQNSGANIDWMAEQGVQFDKEITKLHSSHEFAWGHAPVGKAHSSNGGAELTQPLADKFEAEGGEILLTTWATELIKDGEKVTGVKAENQNGDQITITAKNVVLATGGFTGNTEMMSEYHPYLKKVSHTGNTGNTGDGLRMAMDAGAKTLFHDSAIDLGLNFPTYYGYGEEYKGLLVTPDAKRFMDESLFHFRRTRILMDLDENVIWAITDQSNDRVEQAVEMGTGFKADSLEALAEAAGLDAANLAATVESYNALAAAGADDEFGKAAEFLQAIEGPTYYALRYDMGTSGTIGGLVINEKGQVLNEADQPIEGLYAAGEIANGQLMYKEYPGSGTSIMFCVHYGRVAGTAAGQAATQ